VWPTFISILVSVACSYKRVTDPWWRLNESNSMKCKALEALRYGSNSLFSDATRGELKLLAEGCKAIIN